MTGAFITLFNMSVCATWLIILLLLLRPLLKAAPRSVYFVLWIFLGVRLVFPFMPTASFSVIPSADTIPSSIVTDANPYIHSGIFFINSTVNPIISENLAPAVQNESDTIQVVLTVASYIWLAGLIFMLAYIFIYHLILRQKTRASLPFLDNAFVCDYIAAPFTTGIFKPKIYLPSSTREADIAFILAHERAHIKRLDFLWKLLAFLVLSIHWFNPLVWVAFLLFCRDVEYACDERVIKSQENEYRRDYATALVNCNSMPARGRIYPLSFSSSSVKSRIERILKYKKPGALIYIASCLLCILTALLFMTNPIPTKAESFNLPTAGEAAYSFYGEHSFASLGFNTDTKTFSFSPSYLSSSIFTGEYIENEKYVILNTKDEGLCFVFEKNGDSLVFNAERSSPVPYYKFTPEGEASPSVPDKAVFRADN